MRGRRRRKTVGGDGSLPGVRTTGKTRIDVTGEKSKRIESVPQTFRQMY